MLAQGPPVRCHHDERHPANLDLGGRSRATAHESDFTNEPISSNVLVFNPAYAKAHPEVVHKVLLRMVESYRRGVADPRYWVRERGDWLKEVDDAKLEPQMRDIAKIVDVNGGIERLHGAAAMKNLEFQVTAGNLSGPVSKWKPEQFFDTKPLESVLKELKSK